jgi:hypothetical protein
MELFIGMMVVGIFVGDFAVREWRQNEWKRALRREQNEEL